MNLKNYAKSVMKHAENVNQEAKTNAQAVKKDIF